MTINTRTMICPTVGGVEFLDKRRAVSFRLVQKHSLYFLFLEKSLQLSLFSIRKRFRVKSLINSWKQIDYNARTVRISNNIALRAPWKCNSLFSASEKKKIINLSLTRCPRARYNANDTR